MSNDELPIEDLGNEIVRHAQRISIAMHELLTHIRRFDEADGWKLDGERSYAIWLGHKLELGSSTAHERVRIARALGKLELIDAAFARGEISYSKVRAITRVATNANEETLLGVARTSSAAELEEFCRNLRKRRRPPAPTRFVRKKTVAACAMVRIELQLTPSEAEHVWRTLTEAADIRGRSGADPDAVTSVVNLLTALVPAATASEEVTSNARAEIAVQPHDAAHVACATPYQPCQEVELEEPRVRRTKRRSFTASNGAPQSVRG